MITQKDKERMAFTWSYGNLPLSIAKASNEWYALGNSQPFKVVLLFEGTLPARGWISAMQEGDK